MTAPQHKRSPQVLAVRSMVLRRWQVWPLKAVNLEGGNKMAKKMTMKEYEKSALDKKIDKKMGYKEGSKADVKADKKNLAAINKKRMAKKK
ncbi:hypothetical protein D3C76_476170 [compost metagenome]